MKTIAKEIVTAVLATLLFAIVLCGIYPVVIWGISLLLFPHAASGSLVESRDRRIVGSELLGQNFAGTKYFHPRPSAAGANGYDAANSGGSNLGPTSQKLVDAVKSRAETYRTENALPAGTLIPGDAVTASASGLDPHISIKNAGLQVPRIAKARGLGIEVVQEQVKQATDGRSLGFLGEPGVNVLKVNIALDNLPVH